MIFEISSSKKVSESFDMILFYSEYWVDTLTIYQATKSGVMNNLIS